MSSEVFSPKRHSRVSRPNSRPDSGRSSAKFLTSTAKQSIPALSFSIMSDASTVKDDSPVKKWVEKSPKVENNEKAEFSSSISSILNKRDEMNEKIEKRRKEKARLARIKAIEELNNQKLAKVNQPPVTKPKKQPKKYKLSPRGNKPPEVKSPKQETKIITPAGDNETPLQSARSSTLDAILDDLKKLEASEPVRVETKKFEEPEGKFKFY